jgi:predicted transcriptional regulator
MPLLPEAVATTLPPKEDLLRELREMLRRTDSSERELGEYLKPTRHQSVISRQLHGKRHFEYDEIKQIADTLTALASSIPPNFMAKDIATMGDKVVTASLDDPLLTITRRMLRRNFSQLPVIGDDRRYVGLISEMSIVRFLLSPKSIETLKKMEGNLLKVRDLKEHLDEAPAVFPDEPLQTLALEIRHHYAVPLWKEGRIAGIVTRADFLKLGKILKNQAQSDVTEVRE